MTNLGNKQVFSKNLRRYIERSGRTQKEIAEQIGVAQSTFNDWATAKKYPRIDKIEMLANIFGILKSDLIEEKGDDWLKTQKNNNQLADLVVKMRTDEDFMLLVRDLSLLSEDKLTAVKSMVSALLK